MKQPLRIANISGFYGDRPSVAEEMLRGGRVDFLTGDYLAELTMLILHKAKRREPGTGYAISFLHQVKAILASCVDQGVKIVVNAGGLNPCGLAVEVKKLAEELDVSVRVAHIEGDDILARIEELMDRGHSLEHLDRGIPLNKLDSELVSANVYLGAWGIVEALSRNADIVICPRVTDASLVVGPAAWYFEWARCDWDELASAVVAGHLLECGPQVTGGNYAFFQEIPSLEKPGFPLVEISADGSFVVTKHPNTDGLVSRGTVTAQLLYEIAEPSYKNPDVIARFDTINIDEVGTDRVRISGVRGDPRPDDLKVCINYVGGYRNSMTLVLTGLDIEAKAELAKDTILAHLGGRERFENFHVDLIRSDHVDAETNDQASASLIVTVMDQNRRKVGRSFSNSVIHMLLASFPGIYTTTPPSNEKEFGVYWPALLSADEVQQIVIDPEGERILIPHTEVSQEAYSTEVSSRNELVLPNSSIQRLPLGTVIGARSGDKGGNANVGLWARSDLGYVWLEEYLTVDRFITLCPEAAEFDVIRFELPNLRALNFVIIGLLGHGVASSTRSDPQAKSLGEYIRSRVVDLPEILLGDRPTDVRLA